MSTDSNGALQLSAFAGDYEISLNGQKQTLSIDKNAATLVVMVNQAF